MGTGIELLSQVAGALMREHHVAIDDMRHLIIVVNYVELTMIVLFHVGLVLGVGKTRWRAFFAISLMVYLISLPPIYFSNYHVIVTVAHFTLILTLLVMIILDFRSKNHHNWSHKLGLGTQAWFSLLVVAYWVTTWLSA